MRSAILSACIIEQARPDRGNYIRNFKRNTLCLGFEQWFQLNPKEPYALYGNYEL